MMNLTVLLCLFLSMFAMISLATEVKYTPNEHESGPLPLSQSQRDQLTQLEQAIVQSSDPQATLVKVAEANNMDPQDLVNMLERNRSDRLQAGGGDRQMHAWPQQVVKVLSAIGVVISQLAAKNPKAFSILAVSLLCCLYIGVNAPRNGVIMSSNSGLFSKGHTTCWLPPTKYIDRIMASHQFIRKVSSIQEMTLDLSGIQVSSDDGVQWHSNLGRKAILNSAAIGQVTIRLDDFIPESLLEDQDDDEVNAIRNEVANILYEEAAINVLANRRLSEFTDNKMRFQSSTDDRHRYGVLILPKAGDWGRYGLQPFKVAHQSQGEAFSQIKYSTLKGGVFDGQVHFVVEQTKEGNVMVQVRVLIPKKGRRLSKKLATAMVSSLASSLARSIRTEANQRLARQLQGKRFSEKAKSRAEERRHFRHEKEKQLEDMAQDRRRRWQRGNPDAGRYRPSGSRLKSPYNR